MYNNIFNKLIEYYASDNSFNEHCLRTLKVEKVIDKKITQPEVKEDTPTNEVAIIEPTEEYIVKKNIFGDLVARSKK